MPWIVLGAIAIGLSLGMLGSGGSILTVPVLIYLLGQPEKPAIASSLAIVGGIQVPPQPFWSPIRRRDRNSSSSAAAYWWA